MTAVQLRKLRKNYGDVEVIHGVDLDIKDGEFVVFVGPSGCGKSTLLRTIAGLEDSKSGSIHIGNHEVTDVDAAERGIAMVFQSYALYPHMTVYDNMGFGLKMTGHSKEEIDKRVREASRVLKLDEYLERFPKNLSGGQRQRVTIGRAIVRNPKVFLFDEPLSNLDAELRVQMRIEIARLHEQVDATMIYVTHDQVEAMTLADKIVVLEAGYIRQVGAPLELYDDPNNQFVAGFIGSPKMNFVKAKVASVDAKGVSVSVEGLGDTVLALPQIQSPLSVGAELTLGIRPEHMEIGEKGDGLNAKLPVTLIENLGETSYSYSRLADGTQITVESRGNRIDPKLKEISINVPAEKALLFDLNGERIR